MQECCLNHLLIKYQMNQLSSSKAASLIKMLSISVSIHVMNSVLALRCTVIFRELQYLVKFKERLI